MNSKISLIAPVIILLFLVLTLFAVFTFEGPAFFLTRFANRNLELAKKIKKYEDFVKKHPTYIHPRLKLADFHLQLYKNEPDKKEHILSAIRECKTILATDPFNEKTLEKLAGIFLFPELNELQKSEFLYQKLTKRYPAVTRYHLLLASNYFRGGETDKALAEANKAFTLDPDDGNTFLLLGGIYAKKNDLAETLYAYKEAAVLFAKKKNRPLEAFARLQLGRLYFATGFFFDAAKEFRYLIDNELFLKDALIGLAETYQRMGLYRTSIDLLLASPLDPGSWDLTLDYQAQLSTVDKLRIFLILGQDYLMTGDLSNSVKYLTLARSMGIRFPKGFISALERSALAEKGKAPSPESADILAGTEVSPDKLGKELLDIQSSLDRSTQLRQEVYDTRDTVPDEITVPWEKVTEKYKKGTVVSGKITRILPFGLYVELEKNVTAFLPSSELSWSEKNINPEELFSIGQEIKTVVLNVNNSRKKLYLGHKQLEKDPWKELAGNYSPGNTYEGTIKGISDFGITVELANGLEGLLPIFEVENDLTKISGELYKIGAKIEVRVIKIDEVSREILLSRKGLEKDEKPD